VKKPALGKGLDAILGPRLARDSQPLQQSDGNSVSQAPPSLCVDIEKVTAGRGQPRRIFRDDAPDELASIKEKASSSRGRDEDVGVGTSSAGERRLSAASSLDHVPVIVKSYVEPAELLELRSSRTSSENSRRWSWLGHVDRPAPLYPG
jgi:hypothetical protein